MVFYCEGIVVNLVQCIFTAWCADAYAAVRCPSVRPSVCQSIWVCHVRVPVWCSLHKPESSHCHL